VVEVVSAVRATPRPPFLTHARALATHSCGVDEAMVALRRVPFLSSRIADSAPANLRGTAFGLFNLLTGVALLVASVVAGLLWDGAGFQATFLVGAGFTGATLVGVMRLR
jgi:hypothetical protein